MGGFVEGNLEDRTVKQKKMTGKSLKSEIFLITASSIQFP